MIRKTIIQREALLSAYLDYIQESEELDEQWIKKAAKVALPLAAAGALGYGMYSGAIPGMFQSEPVDSGLEPQEEGQPGPDKPSGYRTPAPPPPKEAKTPAGREKLVQKGFQKAIQRRNVRLAGLGEKEELPQEPELDDVDKELEEQGGFLPTFAKGLAMAAPGLAVGQLTGNPIAGLATSVATSSAMQAYQQAKVQKEKEKAQKEREQQLQAIRARGM